ncbi:MAG: methyl-accepting chemotaxis protein, partial [Gemmatimonadota bacterium]|nr:methyl-accepting chemotaxis protein [Gemmatimonadota bacterium]
MHWTVGRRILAGFGVTLLLVAGMAAVALVSLQRTATVYDRLIDVDLARLTLAERAQSQFRRANVFYLSALFGWNAGDVGIRDSSVAASRADLAMLRDSSASAEQRQLWTRAIGLLNEWDDSSRAVLAQARTGNLQGIAQRRQRATVSSRDSLRATVIAGVNLDRADADSAVRAAHDAIDRTDRLVVVVAVLIILLGITVATFLNRAVTGPLRETSAVLASGSAEILAATTQQASGTAETSTAVSETVTTLEEVSQTAAQAAQRAKDVADRAGRAADVGKAGRQAIEASEAGVQGVRTQVESIAASILALAEQAQAIGEIIASVNDVAEQTNLLALNASVEAARAGEHGRGFAVVAGEIRTLASESKKATVQVRQILGEIQRATGSAVMTTEQGTKHAAAVSAQVKEAGETIRRLVADVADAA